MKKIIVTLTSFLFFLVTSAQVVTFLSPGSATVKKDANGHFADIKIWVIQQTHIKFNLTQNKLQFLSKGLLDTDTFTLRKEIFIVDKITSPNIGDDQTRIYDGLDPAGRKCLIRFKASNDEFKVQDGELQIEYIDHTEIYKLRKLRNNPVLNKS